MSSQDIKKRLTKLSKKELEKIYVSVIGKPPGNKSKEEMTKKIVKKKGTNPTDIFTCDGTATTYNSLKKDDLLRLAKKCGVNVFKSDTKKEIVDKIAKKLKKAPKPEPELEEDTESDAEELEEVSESESDDEPLPDEEYYGEIPDNVDYKKLVKIMAKGLDKYAKQQKMTLDEMVEKDYTLVDVLMNVLDGWFEHDSVRDNKFDYVISEDEFDEFSDDVKKNSTVISEYLEDVEDDDYEYESDEDDSESDSDSDEEDNNQSKNDPKNPRKSVKEDEKYYGVMPSKGVDYDTLVLMMGKGLDKYAKENKLTYNDKDYTMEDELWNILYKWIDNRQYLDNFNTVDGSFDVFFKDVKKHSNVLSGKDVASDKVFKYPDDDVFYNILEEIEKETKSIKEKIKYLREKIKNADIDKEQKQELSSTLTNLIFNR